MAGPIRLQKYLSQAGVASRREAERLIAAGRVRVDGSLVTEPGTRVEPDASVVEVDGRPVRPAPPRWIMLNKPRGYLTTRRDPEGRRTIYDLLPAELHGLFYVGRLDRDSEGLVLLTNDGVTANRLLHPRYGVPRVYEVETATAPNAAQRAALLHGVLLEDGPARARQVRTLPTTGTGRARTSVTLREGRKREVRRMFEAVALPVLRLRRTRYGPLRLGGLRRGAWRELTTAEIGALAR